jgi:uncharacterized repeat protein (TIGR01451 family)
MKKTRLIMLVGVLLLSLALVGMALAADNAQQPQPSNVPTTSLSAGSDAEKAKPSEPQSASIPLQAGILGVSTDYGWSQSVESYEEIIGGTPVTTSCDDDNFNAYTIPFSFTFNGVAYTQFSIQCNGFIAMGPSVVSSYTPISSGTSNNVISALAADLQTNLADSELRFETLGTSPDQVLVIQWKNFRHYAATGDAYNFQIRLYETSNLVEIVFGPFTQNTTNRTQQVGLRGNTNADFNNRKGTAEWINSAAGTLNSDSMVLTSVYFPPSGLTWDWAPIAPHPIFDASSKNAPSKVVVGDSIPYEVHIVNSGTDDADAASLVDPIPVGTTYNDDVTCTAGSCSFDGENVVWNGTLAPAEEVVVTFSVWTDDLPCGTNVVNQATLDDPDLFGGPVVKTASTSLTSVAPALTESFDGATFPPTGWGQDYIVGSSNWDRQTSGTSPTILPHSGAAMARWNSYSISEGNSTRLYSPVISVVSGDMFTFFMSHDTGYAGYIDSITPQISTDGGASWIDLDAPIMRYDASFVVPNWGKHQYDLSVYAGETNVVIGLLAYSDYGNNIFVDDVSVAPLWYPCPLVNIGPDQSAEACAGASVQYPMTVENINPFADTIDVTVSDNVWETTVNPTSLVLDPGASGGVMVTVNVPADAVPPDEDTARIEAMGQGSGLAGIAQVNTKVKAPEGMVENWESVATGAEPSLFWGHSYYYNGDVCVLGGLTGSTPGLTGAHNCYDISTGTWSARPSIPTPVYAGAYGLIGDKFYIAGGFMDGNFNATDLLQIYDITAGSWSTGTSMPSLRGGAAGGVVNGLLYSAGGSPTSSFPADCVTYAYDPLTDTWATLASCPLQGGYGFDLGGSVGSDVLGKLFVGGHFGAYTGWYSYDPIANSWTTLANLPGGVHKTPLFVENPTSGQIYMIGGLVGWAGTNKTYEYNPIANTWTQLPPLLNTTQGGSAGPANGSFGDPLKEGFWTVGGTVGAGSISPAPFEYWEYSTTICEVQEGPEIVIDPPALFASQGPNEVTQQVLNIDNIGTEDLTWELSEGLGMVGWEDNFDGYPTGVSLHGLGGWKGWGNNPAATAYTSDTFAFSPPNSVDINGDSDLVHEYSGYTSGVWTYSAMQYIPSGMVGQSYFILLNQYDDAGVNNNWSTQVYFDYAAGLVVNTGLGAETLPIITDQWVSIQVVIDLDNDVQTFYYGGDMLYTGSWKDGISGGGIANIAAVDLFANLATSVYYDDISLASPAVDIPWLSEAPTSGTTPPGGSVPVDVTFDSTGLMPGTYMGSLFATSNDVDEPVVEVPVTLEVVGQLPDIDVTPTELSSSQAPDQQMVETLNIANVGGDFLDWNIYEDNAAGLSKIVPSTPAPASAPAVSNSLSQNTSFAPATPGQVMKSVDSNLLALINDGSFENGPPPGSAWTEVSDQPCEWIGDWSSVWGVAAFDGIYDYWAGGYCGGIPTTSHVSQAISVPAGNPTLSFWYLAYRPDPDDANPDYAYISVDGTNVWTLDLIQANNSYPNWVNVTLDLSAYAGQDVTLAFGAVSAGSNTGNIRFDYIEWLVSAVCESPTDIPWLSESPTEGSTPGGESTPVDVTFDSTGLQPDIYTAVLCVASNDVDEPLVIVPVTLEVLPPDIFVTAPPLEMTLYPGQDGILNFTIENVGVADLIWSVTDGADWLYEFPEEGLIPPEGAPQVVDVHFDATLLIPGTYTTDVVISSNDPDTPEIVLPATLTIIPYISDLSLVKTANADAVRVGDMITYTLVVSNAGPDAAMGVTVVDTLPIQVTFVSASAGCTEASGVVTCAVGDLGVHEGTTLTIVVTASTEGIAGNVAVVGSDSDDPNPADNESAADVLINPEMFYFYLPIVQKH